MRAIDADRLKEHIDKLPALPDGNFAGNHSALKALINMQPSVEPERNPGKWEWDQRAGEYVCSECGCNPIYERTTPDISEIDKYRFCRWCGAKMMDEQTLKYADTDTAFGDLQSAT